MRRRNFLGLAAALSTGMAAERSSNGEGRVPVLVELFTSQGCSSCPPADSLLARLVDEQPVAGAEIVALSLHVDYWNRLGWKDPYSSRANTHRQLQYQQVFATESVYTPQMVVNGRRQFVGSDVRAALDAIRKESANRSGRVRMQWLPGSNGDVRISWKAEGRPSGSAELWLAAVQPEVGNPVPRGENRGQTLQHRNVLSVIKKIASVNLAASEKTISASTWKGAVSPGTRLVAWLQDPDTMAVYASVK